jgi:OOP family OmpA-OmpF porin
MPESLFASLLHSIDRRDICQIASTVGESEQGVLRGIESSIAAVLGALASKAEDPGALHRMLDLVPEPFGDISWPKLMAALSNPASPLLSTGKRMVSCLFGSCSDAVANAIARECGVSEAAAMTLLSMAAPLVLGCVKKRVHYDGLSMKGLGTILHRESPSIRGALSAGLVELLWPSGTAAAAASPVIAQSVQPERSYAGWVGAVGVALLVVSGLWLWSHARRVVPNVAVTPTGEASRMANEGSTGGTVRRTLPGGIGIDLPANGTETRLLSVMQGTTSNQNTWIDMDHMHFDTGSATLRPDAAQQLDNTAAILQAYPNVYLMIGGYTDDVGSEAKNMDLSQARAESVKDALVSRNISADRLSTQGFGEQHAAADNSTEAGRAKNRRVALRITQM